MSNAELNGSCYREICGGNMQVLSLTLHVLCRHRDFMTLRVLFTTNELESAYGKGEQQIT